MTSSNPFVRTLGERYGPFVAACRRPRPTPFDMVEEHVPSDHVTVLPALCDDTGRACEGVRGGARQAPTEARTKSIEL